MSQTCLSDMSKGELGAKAVKSILNNYDCLLLAIEEICNNCTNPEMSAKGKDVIRRKVSTQIDNKSKSQFFFKNKLDEMKISVYYELLDDLLSAMESRFNQETLSLIEAIASLLHMEIKPEMIDILAKFSNTSRNVDKMTYSSSIPGLSWSSNIVGWNLQGSTGNFFIG
ncbi:hypothetical protein QTP88_023735 [Uroleucon formosanum]